MKKFFQCVGTLIYSGVVSYLLWLLFDWATPYVMGFGLWMYILLVTIVGSVATIIASFGSLLAIPMLLLTRSNKVAKVINALPMLYFGYSAICLPWKLDIDYGVLQYLLCLSLSGIVLTVFGNMILASFKEVDDILSAKTAAKREETNQ